MTTAIRIRLGRDDVLLRPSFRAVQEIEARLEGSIGQLYQALGLGALTLAEIAVIVTEGANEGGAALKAEDVARVLFERGVYAEEVQSVIARFLLECAYGPEQGGKKFEAEWRGSTQDNPLGVLLASMSKT